MGPYGKGREMFSEASGGEQLEQLMTWGIRVTKREREREMTTWSMFVFQEMSTIIFANFLMFL